MVRVLLCSLVALGLCAAGARADDQNKKATKDQQNQGQQADKTKGEKEAKIVNVDTKKGTVTVQMPDKNGKETKKTFHLTGEVRYLDSTGRVAAADIFRTGDYVLVVEEEGHLKQIRQKGAHDTHNKDTNKKDTSKKPGGK
jgi:hypothetical protein